MAEEERATEESEARAVRATARVSRAELSAGRARGGCGAGARTLMSKLRMVSIAEPMRTSILLPWGEASKKGRVNSFRKGSISHVTILPPAGSTW
eukprot:scaffold21094_cov65-Phaeocystis_antarctica.AAC.1